MAGIKVATVAAFAQFFYLSSVKKGYSSAKRSSKSIINKKENLEIQFVTHFFKINRGDLNNCQSANEF